MEADARENAKAELDRIFLDATDDLPDDVSDGIDALLAHPETVIAALGGERVAWKPNVPLYVFPVPGSLPTTEGETT